MGSAEHERAGVTGASSCLGEGAGWRGLDRKLRSVEQNCRAEGTSRSLKSELSSAVISPTWDGAGGGGGAVLWVQGKGRELSSM